MRQKRRQASQFPLERAPPHALRAPLLDRVDQIPMTHVQLNGSPPPTSPPAGPFKKRVELTCDRKGRRVAFDPLPRHLSVTFEPRRRTEVPLFQLFSPIAPPSPGEGGREGAGEGPGVRVQTSRTWVTAIEPCPPIDCVKATRAPGTWFGPASPRSCVAASTI